MSEREASIATYGGILAAFFAEIHNAARSSAATGLDDPGSISLKRIIEQRERTPFPMAADTEGHRNQDRLAEANRLIRVLNETEDIVVFRIAVNALLLLIQKRTGYRPYFDGREYSPDLLQSALEYVEET